MGRSRQLMLKKRIIAAAAAVVMMTAPVVSFSANADAETTDSAKPAAATQSTQDAASRSPHTGEPIPLGSLLITSLTIAAVTTLISGKNREDEY